LLSSAAALAACTPSPQESSMHKQGPDAGTAHQEPKKAGLEVQSSGTPNPVGRGGGGLNEAALGPIPQPVSAAENPAPAPPADSPAEAQGRRTLSTAFVRVGPDGRLTVELRDGRVLDLKNVVMRASDYCGEQVLGGSGRAKFCGGYAEVAAARPGGTMVTEEPDVAVSKPL
jgi:hypothetical protein